MKSVKIEDVEFLEIEDKENKNISSPDTNSYKEYFNMQKISIILSIVSFFISLSFFCLKSIRIEPFKINGESFVNFSAGIMAIATTVIVGWQIINHMWINKKITKLNKLQNVVNLQQNEIFQTERKLDKMILDFKEYEKAREGIIAEIKSNNKVLKLTEYYNHYNIGLSYLMSQKYLNAFRALLVALLKLLELGDKFDKDTVNSVLDKLNLCASSIQVNNIDHKVYYNISMNIDKTHENILSNRHYNHIKDRYERIYRTYLQCIIAIEY